MLIRAYSDIHLETRVFEVPPLDTDANSTLVLAGDLDTGIGIFKNKWPKTKGAQKFPWILTVAKRFKHVVVVYGNHDYWSEHFGHAEDKARRLLEAMGVDNVHILSGDSVVLDGVKFIGTTLWTDYNNGDMDCMLDAEKYMNDFRYIRKESRQKISHATFFLNKHRKARSFIEHELAEPFDGEKVVVTHHAPSHKSYPERRELYERGQYASDLESIMLADTAPKFWFHGHIHGFADYQVGNTRVIANAVGYHLGDLPTPVYDTSK